MENPGDKVGTSEATLLNRLDNTPFSYGLQIEQVYDSGSIFSPDINPGICAPSSRLEWPIWRPIHSRSATRRWLSLRKTSPTESATCWPSLPSP